MDLNRVEKIDNQVSINNVIITVADKRNLETLIPRLLSINPDIKIYSTGGTFKRIGEIAGEKGRYTIIPVTEFTGQPEMQGGLVKTLDFKIYLGLLSEQYNEAHQEDITRVGGIQFDLVVVNLYPFAETIRKEGVTLEDARSNIDIGGPCMLRAAAKNFLRVASVCDPDDYSLLLDELERTEGKLSVDTRFRLAKKAFAHTAKYDTEIMNYLDPLDSEAPTTTYTSV